MSFNPPKIAIVIAGATATGKTETARLVAHELFSQGFNGAEVVSADARQIYAGMPIGTCAPIETDISHHLVGVLDPRKRCTAFWWGKEAARIIEEIHNKNIVPLIVGGTGLYLKALVEGIFEGPGEDSDLRESLYKRHESGENLYYELAQIDPASAEKIHPKNIVRIIRALEVYYKTGRPISEEFHKAKPLASGWDFLLFRLVLPREELYRRIDERTKKLIENGWIEETKGLLAKGIRPNSPGMNAIGYREICRFLAGEIDRRTLIEDISRKTRNYAKRQMTWFNNRPGFIEIDMSHGKIKAVEYIVGAFERASRDYWHKKSIESIA